MEVAPISKVLTTERDADMADSTRKDWRELCAAAAEEPDSERLASLVNQILQVFDERDQEVMPSAGPKQYCVRP
jgi:hypothetical protein